MFVFIWWNQYKGFRKWGATGTINSESEELPKEHDKLKSASLPTFA